MENKINIDNIPIKIEIYKELAIITQPVILKEEDNFYKNIVKTVKVESLIKAFNETELNIASPILPLNCIKYKESGNSIKVILLHEERHFNAIVSEKIYDNCIRPNLIFVFTLRKDAGDNYAITNTQAYGIKDSPAIVSDRTILYGLPFPNVGADGWVCWGNNSISGTFKSLVGLRSYCDRFFASPFNNHLFNSYLLKNHNINNHYEFFKYLQNKPMFNYDLMENLGTQRTIGDI